jgi:transcriptional regulator with XRE-family HTH domain
MPPFDTQQMLAETIREIREQREMTQQQLAKKCRIHRVSMQRIEAGSENPSTKTLVAIAAALDILPSELFRRFNRRIMKAIAAEQDES